MASMSNVSNHQVRGDTDVPNNHVSLATMQRIPNELLIHIFSFLDAPRTSILALADEPNFKITHAPVADLKAVSLVSRRWRRAILPRLFKHARLIIPRSEGFTFIPKQKLQPFLDFSIQHSLSKVITSFTLVVEDGQTVEEGVDTSPAIADFWETLFDAIDPTDLLIIVPAVTLGVLTSCRVYMDDAWAFDCPYHYLRLQRPSSSEQPLPDDTGEMPDHNLNESSSGGVSGSTTDKEIDLPPKSCSPLFAIRPWTSLLLNEGSFVKAYATYEFWLRHAPSILQSLLGAEDEERNRQDPRICSTIRDLSYIGVFPMASHFAVITMNFPRLDRFYIQVVPRDDILQDPVKMRQIEAEDLWMERNSCYALVMRELFNSPPNHNFKHIRIFESGDPADKEAWNLAVEFINRVDSGWKVTADGVFERDPEDIVTEIPENYEVGFSMSVNQFFNPYHADWNNIGVVHYLGVPSAERQMFPCRRIRCMTDLWDL